MTKKYNRYQREKRFRKKEENQPFLSEGARRGIAVIVLFVLAFITLLSFFDLAGKASPAITIAAKILFGRLYFLLPIIFLGLGYALLRPSKYPLAGLHYLGLLLFILSSTGLAHYTLPLDQATLPSQLADGGGYFGLVLNYPLQKVLGFWASVIVLVALLLISLLIIFNTSPQQIKTNYWQRFKQQLKLFFLSRKYGGETAASGEQIFTQKPIAASPENLKTEEPSILTQPQLQIEKKPRRYVGKIEIPLDLLNGTIAKPTSGDIRANMAVIQKTLENFGIPVEMGEVCVGPTVTQFTLRPADGVKLSQITALHNDLALALASHPIRIEAPIPGKALVGIEVPNQTVAIVPLRETLASEEFKNRKSNLMVALGKDVAGKVWIADLDKMPHLLVAGATGSGKSVALNSIIISLLYQNGPEDLKFILVDPKRVEFLVYNGIPHLLTPVITEVQKTVNALKWAIIEMDRRFELLSKFVKRDIHVFNREMPVGVRLPFIVIVIDELADLMTTAGAEVEAAIIRLAQMARAVGIHLVVATQRPSVDIITGLIKANITSRIAFSVASQIDSRTILDTAGAEKLLGRGDMLFICPEISKPKRLQGALVADEEIKKVVNFLKTKAEPEYSEEITQSQSAACGIPDELSVEEEEELLNQAKEEILRIGKASASFLQRRLRIGYARAARILDLLENQGFIGPGDGARPREILAPHQPPPAPNSQPIGEQPPEEFDKWKRIDKIESI